MPHAMNATSEIITRQATDCMPSVTTGHMKFHKSQLIHAALLRLQQIY